MMIVSGTSEYLWWAPGPWHVLIPLILTCAPSHSPDRVTKRQKVKSPVFLSPIFAYPNCPQSGLASMESSVILKALLLASTGLVIGAAISPAGSAARKPGNAWYTGPEANFPGMMQEEKPRLAASRAKLQPDTPFSIFSLVSPCYLPSARRKS